MDKEADEPERAGLHLARNLTSLRHARALTQDALAAASGLPRSTIANLESGEANPSLAVLVKVASTLGVPIDELLAAPRAKVRKWTVEEIGSRQRGRGVAERPLVPGAALRDGFRPRCQARRHAASAGNPRVLHLPRGPGRDRRRRATPRPAPPGCAGLPRQHTAFLPQPGY